jgi:hypothetical protein
LKFRKATIRKDEDLIRLLNRVYLKNASLKSLTGYLASHKFNIEHETKGEKSIKTISYYKHAGNLRGLVFLEFSGNSLLSKKIILATDSKFDCPSKQGSFVYNYIDFVYLRKLIKKIKFPLKVANSNVELESR